MPVRPAARHRAPRHRAPRLRRRNLGVLCAVLLVPMTALAAMYVSGNAGITPTGLAQAGHGRRAPDGRSRPDDRPRPPSGPALCHGVPEPDAEFEPEPEPEFEFEF